MLELYAQLNPVPFEAAAQTENDFAVDLCQSAHAVTGRQ